MRLKKENIFWKYDLHVKKDKAPYFPDTGTSSKIRWNSETKEEVTDLL